MKPMRLTNQAFELDQTIKFYREHKVNFLLWQNHGEVRHRFKAQISHIDKVTKDIYFSLSALDEVTHVDRKFTLYFFGEHKWMVFKTIATSVSSNEVSIPFPSNSRMEEMRTNKRHNVGQIGNCNIVVTKKNTTGMRDEYNFRLYDISTTGFSFLINASQKENFKPGEDLLLTSVMSDSFKGKKAKICYLSQVGHQESLIDLKQLKVGLHFEEKLELHTLYLYRKYLAFQGS